MGRKDSNESTAELGKGALVGGEGVREAEECVREGVGPGGAARCLGGSAQEPGRVWGREPSGRGSGKRACRRLGEAQVLGQMAPRRGEEVCEPCDFHTRQTPGLPALSGPGTGCLISQAPWAVQLSWQEREWAQCEMLGGQEHGLLPAKSREHGEVFSQLLLGFKRLVFTQEYKGRAVPEGGGCRPYHGATLSAGWARAGTAPASSSRSQ